MPAKLTLLMCSPFPLDRRLGAPKVLMELAEALPSYGWEITLVDQGCMLKILAKIGVVIADTYQENLRRYLHEVSGQFDVVDFDHEYLPFSRLEFASSSLMVARSVLFALHHRWTRIPILRRPRDVVLDLFRAARPPCISEERIGRITESLRQADLINVSNSWDLREIQRNGLGAEKTCVFPYGFHRSRNRGPETPDRSLPDPPRIVFVGTFDGRKGGTDFPLIFERIVTAIPGVQFRMLGTGGVYRTARDVKDFFPRRLRSAIEVIPSYEPEDLPELLQDCSAGIFPSYLEGFAFAILEMTAAGLPVLAYDAPGAGDILEKDALVAPGDKEEMAGRMIQWLQNPDGLTKRRAAAKLRSGSFDWDDIARGTDVTYREALGKHRAAMEKV